MSISLNHMSYDIMEIASSGGMSNEFKVSLEQIQFWIEEVRSQLISQSLGRRDDINDSWIQYINCVELEQVDSAPCCTAPNGCYILKSKLQIPSTIDTWKDNWLVSVTTMDGLSISKSNPIKQKYQKYNKYTNNTKSWILKDDYLYIINDQILELVSISGLFETPSELERFINCDGDSCFSLDGNYPVSLTLATQITDIVIKTKVNPFMVYPSGTDNVSGSTPTQKIQEKQSE